MTGRQGRLAGHWHAAAVIVVLACTAAVVVILTGRQLAGLEAQRAARGAAADAVAPVADAVRGAMGADSSDTSAGARQISLAEAGSAGIPAAVAIEARDSGAPVLVDSGSGRVVVATYDTGTPPTSVQDRRAHVTGLRVAPLGITTTLMGLRPSGGGISLAGPDRTVQSVPGPRPSGRTAYAVRLAPGPAPDWTLTVWSARSSLPTAAWLAALAIALAGAVAAAALLLRDDRARRSQEELLRLREASASTATLATVAQHSLDLADLLPALTTEIAEDLGLHGLSLGTPTATGERQFFTWGVAPADVPPSASLPSEVRAGETLCLLLSRAGRAVARLRVVAGRDLDERDMSALGAAAEILSSALANAEAYAQQRDLVEQMRSVDELKTVFLATASHELRTPVGAISGYAQLLASSWDSISPEEGRMYAERVDSNAQRLGALVDTLLDFSRLERGKAFAGATVVLDLGQTVARILDEQPDLAPDHQVVHDVDEGVEVVGSVQAVERVVSNLVGNAAKYSPIGTVVRVRVKVRRDRAELAVDDQGPGVPKAEREKIFSRFFRGGGDSVVATHGAGLGLAIVREFAATMSGEVSVSASDDGGARFVVSYPLATPAGSSVEGASHAHT